MKAFLRDVGIATAECLKWTGIIASGIALHGLIHTATEKYFDQRAKPAVKQYRSVSI